MKWTIVGYYWDGNKHYVIYENEKGKTKMQSNSKTFI